MDACEAYARQWAKKEDVELDTLSEWIKSIGEVVKRRIRRLKHFVNTRSESIFRDPDVVRELSRLHENFVIVPADKASNNYTFVCKSHYVDILIEKLGLHSPPGNPTYNLTIWLIFLHQKCLTKTKRRRSDPVPMTKAPTPTEMSKGQSDNPTTPQKGSIKQQLRTDLGRSVGVTTATQLVWLIWFTDLPSHSPQQPCNQNDTHLKICK